jgi:hypothetical protein
VCVFSSPAQPLQGPNSPPRYSEETAFNPTTCEETLVSGTLTSVGQAALASENPEGVAGPTEAPTGGSSSTSTSVRPATLTDYAAFDKVSWVDPFDITINSLTDNLNWYGSGSSISSPSWYGVSYEFPYDNWSNSGISDSWSEGANASWFSGSVAETFNNSDFELIIVAIEGIAGYAACGFNGNPAVFYLAPSTTGYPNGSWTTSWSDSASGGCSDLVHFRQNQGTGWSS